MTMFSTLERSTTRASFRLLQLERRKLPQSNLSSKVRSLVYFPLPPSLHDTTPRSSRSFFTLSFSGAGHLMPYHLGVAKTLLSVDEFNKEQDSAKTSNISNATSRLPIRSVSGSSSGAIAATVMAVMPHRLEEYTERFLQDRGRAFRNLRDMLEEETAWKTNSIPEKCGETAESSEGNNLLLSICTTRCSDGGIELFSFADQSQRDERNHLLKAIEASCRIPGSFHPFDMVALNYKGQNAKDTYPEVEGIEIDGKGYVDGGISAPFPPTPLDGDQQCTGRIVVSPIAGEYFYKTSEDVTLPHLIVVRPRSDASWKAPFIDSVPIFGSGGHHYDVPLVAVRATPSLQNLRNMTTAMGVVPSSPTDHGNGAGILNDWYERGQADAHEMLNKLE